MALRITCPYCSRKHELAEPYPLPGSDLHCWCGAGLSISYPAGLMDRLRKRGIRFQDDPLPGDLEDESSEIPSVGGAPVENINPLPTQKLDKPIAAPPELEEESPLQDLPALDIWKRLNTQETERPQAADPLAEEATIVMSKRQQALKAANALASEKSEEVSQLSRELEDTQVSASSSNASLSQATSKLKELNSECKQLTSANDVLVAAATVSEQRQNEMESELNIE